MGEGKKESIDILVENGHRKIIAKAQEELDDPMETCERLVARVLHHPAQDGTPQKGLLVILEETTRAFREDPRYKLDPRYLRLWIMYASLVENACLIFEWLLSHEIGSASALLYEEYASALELMASSSKANEIFKLGLSKKARPLSRLQGRYIEFQTRVKSKASNSAIVESLSRTSVLCATRIKVFGSVKRPETLPEQDDREELGPSSSTDRDLASSTGSKPSASGNIRKLAAEDEELQRDPLKNYITASPPPSKPGSLVSNCKFTFLPHLPNGKKHPYYHLLNPVPITDKRPERLMFHLPDLLSSEGQESSFEEIRLRQMGLLDKHWPELEPDGSVESANHSTSEDTESEPEADEEQHVAVKFNDQDENAGLSSSRLKLPSTARPVFEPTVTLNTKAALADVFGMYNSPEKTRKLEVAGIKEVAISDSFFTLSAAPTPKSTRIDVFVDDDERATLVTDENAGHSKTPKSTFKPFVEEDVASAFRTPLVEKTFQTPASKRLPLKDSLTTPGPAAKVADEAENVLKPYNMSKMQTDSSECVFSLARSPDATTNRVAMDTNHRRMPSQTVVSSKTVNSGASVFTVFKPSDDEPPDARVLAHNLDKPSLHNLSLQDNGSRASHPIFTPFSHQNISVSSIAPTGGLQSDEGSIQSLTMETPAPKRVSFSQQDHIKGSSISDDAEKGFNEPEVESEEDLPYRLPRSGRCGAINVMTPITERTYEYTSSTRALSTPSEKYSVFERVPEDVIVDKTTTFDITESIAAAAVFKPSNPCNPFDPTILATLLSFLPVEPTHYDLQHLNTAYLGEMQRFVGNGARRGSDTIRSSSTGLSMYDLTLGRDVFGVVSKLGEGGFGAVFRAQEDRANDDEPQWVALKAVKPRNAWEFYILRHLIRSLPPHLHHSIVRPRALYTFQSESIMSLEICDRGTLLELVNSADKGGFAQHGGSGLVEPLVVFFAIELLRIVEGFHRLGFIHGDMKIDNCLVRLDECPFASSAWSAKYDPSGSGGWKYKGIKLIDFGRTIDTRMFPGGQTFIGDWPTDGRDCLELQESRPWTYQVDYFGLAGIFYCMLFGKYLETTFLDGRVKLAQPFKRYWQTDLWARTFDLLLNSSKASSNGLLPLAEQLHTIREEMEMWLADNSTQKGLKGLLKKVEIATE